jgi:hypothetical protein
MIDSEPNYSKYSLEELKCALSSLDETRFPERGSLLRKLISDYSERLQSEWENEILQAKEYLKTDSVDERTLLITNNSSGKKTALFISNLLLLLFIIFTFSKEPSWVGGFLLVVMSFSLVSFFELVAGQLKVSFDKKCLVVAPIGFKLFRREKIISLSNLIKLEQKTITKYYRGVALNSYYLQANFKNGFTECLIQLTSEKEGALIVETINSILAAE